MSPTCMSPKRMTKTMKGMGRTTKGMGKTMGMAKTNGKTQHMQQPAVMTVEAPTAPAPIEAREPSVADFGEQQDSICIEAPVSRYDIHLPQPSAPRDSESEEVIFVSPMTNASIVMPASNHAPTSSRRYEMNVAAPSKRDGKSFALSYAQGHGKGGRGPSLVADPPQEGEHVNNLLTPPPTKAEQQRSMKKRKGKGGGKKNAAAKISKMKDSRATDDALQASMMA